MTAIYLKSIKNLFQKEEITHFEFIKGLKIYDITNISSKNKNYKKRPYVIYKGIKNNEKVIIKILIRENYQKFYQRELFIYKYFLEFFPHIKNVIPQLINYGENPFYMIIKYYDDFLPLGESNILKTKLNTQELRLILEMIDSFHLPKSEIEKKIDKLKLKGIFQVNESFSFYFKRYLRETKKTLINIIGEKEIEKLEKFFLKTRPIFNQTEKYFSWGDANPSNILIKKKNNSVQFKFVDFEKVDYSPIFRDYTTLFYSFYLTDENLALFIKNWLKNKYSSNDFWILFYFKLLIYSLPRQFVNFNLSKDYQKQKKVIQLVKIFLKDYYLSFNHQ